MKSTDVDLSILMQLKKNIALWGVISFLGLVVIPIGFKLEEPYLEVLMSIGTSLFVALTVSFFINKKISTATNFEITELINQKFPKLIQIEKVGFERLVYENKMESVGIDLSESTELFIAMNDGKNFFTNNSRRLSERFKKENKKTTVVLMSPNSDSETILSLRNGKSGKGYYANKINDATKDFIDFHKDAPKTNVLEIRYFEYNISMSVVATENIAVVGLYRNSAGKSLTPPSFIFKNNGDDGEYVNILTDVKNLVLISKVSWRSDEVVNVSP